ncbi:hypothetical protein R1sor_025657 [Riccia sorocarpa]|uniref:Uncharacterized protein n=1 Tax=Riccia sorocarpa TaxID=122646 RepID=A0ABD3GEW4_9MARC
MAQAPSMGFLLIFSAVLSCNWDKVLVHGQTAPQGAEAFFSEIEDAVKFLASSALANYQNRSDRELNSGHVDYRKSCIQYAIPQAMPREDETITMLARDVGNIQTRCQRGRPPTFFG